MQTRNDPLALESQICFALAVASRGVISAYRSVLEPINLTHPQYLVMLALWQHERLPVRKIAELLRLEAATVSPLIKRLEALDYVEKRRSSHDERIVEVSLTETGAKLRKTAEAIPGQMMAKLDMGEADLCELHSTMTRLIEAVDASHAQQQESSAQA
ncbi:MarR family winged helix-turn-helix transcriptional regulator [Brevibacterium aurantiacum]|uniref:HTH-type transcriptional regulator SarZ n=1 Tax=Brevibacterium aurantiacum TaxID=273384 RepID=A0A1D7W4V1_BREAU|nr:MarR family transcriptional regulator [Brevibacterium aurantiacum]AOP54002.1 Organic hydroperoxide resistance transcriptional regulator [Brevibacterium aurantiacum]PCC55577.1 MarR family transcriptional regulator [Brevibacterium aurantiacum]RCS98992.1 MarR family transcriptional regulator [Brevibacterium aurantiacum]SMX77525.1 DNA-binding transcriptional regulator, MarR family [Brevibacterium aurantiacum]